ncbi:hypothetical protein KIN20_021092 [Parelaphostrongylus tenuis]|uniref:Uncharacterized protein n=1 Tax=Parelaphostrongylus tenuis TaxID=148309 RepID=A0AAD5MNN8_PARTN|nr:hypothetical protein KIN20_021092 [Parelaphostrongylus tenuis]
MVYSSSPDVRTRVPGVAAGEGEARAFVQRLVMQTVFDVLESQARSALLPDPIISGILGQLAVKTTYTPVLCQTVRSSLEELAIIGMPQNCIVVGNTVTGICIKMPPAGGAAPAPMMCNGPIETAAVPPQHLTIGGTISTTNIIMANWSRTMWQSVVTRAIRMLALGPFGSHFFSASAVVSGN